MVGLTLSNYQSLNHVAIDLMQLDREPAVFAKDAGFHSLGRRLTSQRRGTTVTVDALRVVATVAVLTQSHTSDETQDFEVF